MQDLKPCTLSREKRKVKYFGCWNSVLTVGMLTVITAVVGCAPSTRSTPVVVSIPQASDSQASEAISEVVSEPGAIATSPTSPNPTSPNPAPSSSATDTNNTNTPDTETNTAETIALTEASFQINPVVTGLDHPWSLAWLPDGSMLITERSGQLLKFPVGASEPIFISGLPDIVAQGQGGLLDITLHPQFDQTPWLYLSYSSGSKNANHNRVMRAELQGDRLQNPEVIFEVSQLKSGTQHFGSRFAWLPDQTLLISIGDGGNPPISLDGEVIRLQSQNLASHLGKVIRINDDGSVPADNPFASVTNADADPLVWSYGHRNIQGLAYDPVADRVWASEHGARGGDEINWVEPGQNYGWPLATHSREYSGGEISPHQSLPGMVDPLVIWTPSIAPSGFMVYRGDRFAQWQGNLFAGGLVSKELQRFEVDENGNIVGQHFIPIGQRVRDIRQGPDGLIYVLTDEDNGQLLRLEPDPL